jgi:hypothetical protein
MLMTDLPQHHSSLVHLSLVTEYGTIRLSQIGPHFVVVSKAQDLPPCDAEIIMRVNGQENRWKVRLVEGISASDRQVATDPL